MRWLLHIPTDAAVSLRTGVGGLAVVGVAGTVRAQTDVGDITAVDVRAEVVELRSSVGTLVADLAVAPSSLVAASSTGDVRVTVPGGGTAYDLRATTAIGTVTTAVHTDSRSPHRLEVSASIGDVTVRPR